MTPKVVRGRSFKGVGLYLLHDKEAQTNDRVTFTETLNLPTANANSAIKHMIDVAKHSDDLKRQAGESMRGQKQQRPVYHYSLAWHPSENVTMDVQMEAARESLKALGIDDRQALIVGHNDTEHPHVHVVVNLVSTENGKFPKLGNDYLKFSEWALDYEQRRGVVFCKEREENQKQRKGEFVKDDSMTRQEWVEWKRTQTKELWDEHRADVAAATPTRKGQFDALWRQKEDRFTLRRDEIKHLYKPIWRDVFKRQKQELKDFDAGLTRRIGFALAKPKGRVLGLIQAIVAKGDLRGDFLELQAFERGEIAKGQKQRIADAGREVTKAWKYDRNQLRDMHKQQDETAREATKTKVDEVWKEKRPLEKSGQDFTETADRRKDKDEREKTAHEIHEGKPIEEVEAERADKGRKAEKPAREGTKPRRRRIRNRNKGRGREMDM